MSSFTTPQTVRSARRSVRGNARQFLSLAASAAATSLVGGAAFADGTAVINNMNGDRVWTTANVWTWTGDTGAQVYPGDGKGPGAGTEAAVARPIYAGRTLNMASNVAGLTALTIGSFTLEQTQQGLTRGLNVNYQGTVTTDTKLQLNTSLIRHVDGAGVVSSGGGLDGLQNALVFNGAWALNGGALVLDAATAPSPLTSSHLNVRGNIAIKFDDSDMTFTNLTVRGTKAVEFEDNNANRPAVWNWSGDINLEGTGQLRLRHAATGNGGDEVAFGTGLRNLIAAAPGTGYANVNFERVTGTVVNRFQFDRTVLNSNLFYDPNNTHVALGVVEVNGVRNTMILDGTPVTGTAPAVTANLAANGSSYSGIEGAAGSEWNLNTSGANWTFNTNVQSTMLGNVAIIDGQAGFNANGAMGAVAIAKRHGVIDLNVDPVATDKFDIRAGGVLRGQGTQFASVVVGTNLTLAKGAIIAHETLGTSAATASTVGNLAAAPNTALFGLSGDTPVDASYDISVGGAADLWAGIGNDRNTRRWNQGVITANGDFTIASAVRGVTGSPITFGNGANSAGALSIVNATGNPEVNVTLLNRVDIAHNNANFVGTHFHVTNGTEVRMWADGAMGSGRATVYAGGLLSASGAGDGGSTAFNGNVHIKSGGALQINSRDVFATIAGLNGTGTITREPNIIVWVNHSEALTGTQFNASNLQNGDLLRIEADNVANLDQVAGGVNFQLRGTNRTFAGDLNLNGGALVTDTASRVLTSGGTINVGPNGATFAAATPTVIFDDPHFQATVNVTGTQTLSINIPVRADAAALAAGVNAAPIRIGSTTAIDRLNMLGNVTFNNAFDAAGNVVKVSGGDLIFDNAETRIGGDLIAGGGVHGVSPNVKFGNNNTNLSGGVVSGTVVGRLILGSGTKTDLNIDTSGFDGTALQSTGRLDVGMKIVVEGGMTTDGKRVYVDRRRAADGTLGLINLNQVTISPGASFNIDEGTATEVRVVSPTLPANFVVDRGSGDAFEFQDLSPAGATTITNGVVSSAAGNGTADIGLVGTISPNVTINNVRGHVRMESGVVFNGTVNTQNVPAGGDSWVRFLGGQNPNSTPVSGSGQINLGGGEDAYGYVDDFADTSAIYTNTVPLRINVLPGSTGTLASERGLEVAAVPGGLVNFTNVHLGAGSTLTVQQQVDTSVQVGGTLQGNAAIRNVDDGRVVVKDFTGPFDLTVWTDANNRTTVFNGNVLTNKVLVGVGGTANGRIRLENGANLPSVEMATNGGLSVNAGQTGTVSRVVSANTSTNGVNIGGVLQIRPAASAAAGTTSKVANLNIAGGATPTGTLDIGAANRLAVDYAAGASEITTVRAQIVAGYAGGAWTGPGITSSSAAANPKLAVGYAEASDLLGAGGGGFGTETVDGSAVLVRTTLYGDATLDGTVDFSDLVRLAQNYETTVSDTTQSWWYSGDFTYDGVVDFNDLVKLAQNYEMGLPSEPVAGAPAEFGADLAMAFASVPEPSTAGLALLASGALAMRRRRRQK
jgi:hypothetical protein